MSKQVVMSMEDFINIESSCKELDRIFYLFECIYDGIEDKEVIRHFDRAFEEFRKCIKVLEGAVK